jgi:hypothetical protein
MKGWANITKKLTDLSYDATTHVPLFKLPGPSGRVIDAQVRDRHPSHGPRCLHAGKPQFDGESLKTFFDGEAPTARLSERRITRTLRMAPLAR